MEDREIMSFRDEDQTTDKTKGPVFRLSLSFYLMPGSSLLSPCESRLRHFEKQGSPQEPIILKLTGILLFTGWMMIPSKAVMPVTIPIFIQKFGHAMCRLCIARLRRLPPITEKSIFFG